MCRPPSRGTHCSTHRREECCSTTQCSWVGAVLLLIYLYLSIHLSISNLFQSPLLIAVQLVSYVAGTMYIVPHFSQNFCFQGWRWGSIPIPEQTLRLPLHSCPVLLPQRGDRGGDLCKTKTIIARDLEPNYQSTLSEPLSHMNSLSALPYILFFVSV